MSNYYRGKRGRNIFDPSSEKPFTLSRSKIELFLNCPRCFYFDRRLGIGQPPGYPFSLNSAVDKLLKKEFDSHRAKGSKHPLIEAYGIDAVPLDHEMIDKWRDSMHGGIQYLHPKTNLKITGGVDDVWINPKGEYIIVDYKATSKEEEVSLDAKWQDGYKHQMEIYQWLFKKNGFKVCKTGYFVYCNGKTDKDAFDAKLEFDIKVIPYEGNTDWVEETITAAHKCLMSDELPECSPDCDFCLYHNLVQEVEGAITVKDIITKKENKPKWFNPTSWLLREQQ